jgi:hypothetical protein
MKHLTLLIALLASLSAVAATLRQPIHSGRYIFQHKFAEHPNMPSISLIATISGQHIVLINEERSDVFPKGVLAEGTLMWHAASGQWIIGTSKSDKNAKEVGGCSTGPDVVDLLKHIYWTC